jgi:hypothetical protein
MLLTLYSKGKASMATVSAMHRQVYAVNMKAFPLMCRNNVSFITIYIYIYAMYNIRIMQHPTIFPFQNVILRAYFKIHFLSICIFLLLWHPQNGGLEFIFLCHHLNYKKWSQYYQVRMCACVWVWSSLSLSVINKSGTVCSLYNSRYECHDIEFFSFISS